MDWLQFSASVIGSLAWPAAVVMLAVLLRQPLTKLIPLIRKLQFKGLQIDIGEQLEEVIAKVEATTDVLLPDVSGAASFKSMAETDARAAMLSAWFPVERELREIASMTDIDQTGPVSRMIRQLIGLGMIESSLGSTLLSANGLRNEAAHLTGPEIQIDQALAMEELCRRLTDRLKKLKAYKQSLVEPGKPLPWKIPGTGGAQKE
ncbi:hypothetical protein [Pseudomonas nitroreducens]|uniref:hypothetical protein n=1 Tax=Pseudomonas nitroreducens TaxID=46680 RepID=UPI002658B466|nr:hypothetical protein [Pseudomonas nitroreducens]MCP1651782.1 hypothetical protein [Pseudomonas nitroreducens]MCP1689590.1 hypothetical protein [Pseudomonas nitroreducens]